MKAIILAAGKGSRISDSIGPIPKSTLNINGIPIIRHTVEMLLARNLEVIICTGYRHEKIAEALQNLPVRYVNNPFYNITNNIASLWFAKEYMQDEDCIIISADVIFYEDLLDRLINVRGDLIMATDTGRVKDGDYFFHMDENGNILEYGPDLPIEKRDCEYIGLDKISAECILSFKNKLIEMIDAGASQCYFEYVFFQYIGNKTYSLSTLDVAGCQWREIDRLNDYMKAKGEFENG